MEGKSRIGVAAGACDEPATRSVRRERRVAQSTDGVSAAGEECQQAGRHHHDAGVERAPLTASRGSPGDPEMAEQSRYGPKGPTNPV
jgi:hypothetical protein